MDKIDTIINLIIECEYNLGYINEILAEEFKNLGYETTHSLFIRMDLEEELASLNKELKRLN